MAESLSTPEKCKNCNADVAKALRCGVCKKATYCSASCQKEDWQYHKRICKKPDPKQEEQPKQSPDDMEEMKRQMYEMTKDKDPEFQKMMAGMMGNMTGMDLGVKEAPKAPEPPKCQSCDKPCAKPQRCGVCKAATYCSPQCQKDDWRFHKRICKKPATPAGSTAAEQSQSAPAAASEPKTYEPPMRPKETEKVVENESVGDWYKHREWKPSEEKKTFEPKKLDATEANLSGSSAASAPASGKSGSSAWNKAGTWEDKNMLPWWQQQLKALGSLGNDTVKVDTLSDIRGEASINMVRGQPKFGFDLSFDLSFSGLQNCKACARSGAGSRCSNCMRIKGKIVVSGWDSEGNSSIDVQHKEADGPSHVKKANAQECRDIANELLMPEVQKVMDESVVAYKGLVKSDGGKWASQLAPKSSVAWEGSHELPRDSAD